MKYLVYTISILLGVGLGQLMFSSGTDKPNANDTENMDAQSNRKRIARTYQANAIANALLQESVVFDRDISFKKAEIMLTEKRVSPIRHRDFLAHRIHLIPTDQLIQALKEGEIQTHQELAEAAKRLTEENPHLVYDLYEKHQIRYGGMEQYYTFSNAMMKTWIKSDPEGLLGRIKKLKRGGAQQDSSLRFSNFWAKHDPAAAAQHFSELIYLRNLDDRSTGKFTGTAYAKLLARFWSNKDPEALTAYVEALPTGQQRATFEQALDQIKPKQDESDK